MRTHAVSSVCPTRRVDASEPSPASIYDPIGRFEPGRRFATNLHQQRRTVRAIGTTSIARSTTSTPSVREEVSDPSATFNSATNTSGASSCPPTSTCCSGADDRSSSAPSRVRSTASSNQSNACAQVPAPDNSEIAIEASHEKPARRAEIAMIVFDAEHDHVVAAFDRYQRSAPSRKVRRRVQGRQPRVVRRLHCAASGTVFRGCPRRRANQASTIGRRRTTRRIGDFQFEQSIAERDALGEALRFGVNGGAGRERDRESQPSKENAGSCKPHQGKAGHTIRRTQQGRSQSRRDESPARAIRRHRDACRTPFQLAEHSLGANGPCGPRCYRLVVNFREWWAEAHPTKATTPFCF